MLLVQGVEAPSPLSIVPGWAAGRVRAAMASAPAVLEPSSRGAVRSSMSLYLRVLPYVRAEWRLLTATVAVMVVVTLLTLAQPWPLQVIVDSVLGDRPAPVWIRWVGAGDRRLLWWAAAAMFLIVSLTQAAALVQEYFSQVLGQRMVLSLRCVLYEKLQRLSLSFHDNRTVGDLIFRVTGDAEALQHIVTYGFVPLIVQLLTAVALTTAIFLLDPTLGLVALLAIPVLAGWTAWSSGRVRHRARHFAIAESSLYSTVSEVLNSIRAVKSETAEQLEVARFETRARASQSEYIRVMAMSTLGNLGTRLFAELAVIAVVVFGALAVLRREQTVGDLLVFIAYLRALQSPVIEAAASAIVLQRSAASIERVVEILDEPDELTPDERRPMVEKGGIELPAVVGNVTFRNVWASYDGRARVLEDINLDIRAGEMVALVGPSGAGKTTLASLLLRFYAPTGGQVLLDGVDVADLDLGWLRRNVSLVLQEPIIFSSSLAENIAYGRPDATREQVEQAATAAGLDEMIDDLPDGLDTEVGERGVRLSGGQRQRLSIARAFLKDARVIVLDEPTSNLDASTERHVFASLDRLARNRTTIVIAHRLATVQRADRIVVLDRGRIVEVGTHSGLHRRGGVYSRLLRDQVIDPRTTRQHRARSRQRA